MDNKRWLAIIVLASGVVGPGCSCTPQVQTSKTTEKSRSEAEKQPEKPAKVEAPSASKSAPEKNADKNLAESKGASNQGASTGRDKSSGGKGSKAPSVTSIGRALLGGSDGGEETAKSPQAAHKEATQLQKSALDLEKNGQNAEAFAKALGAWQLVRAHPADAACAGLEKELDPLLARLGEAANVSVSHTGRVNMGKPLKVE